MKHLESSIALRIMDVLGIFTKDMPNIRNELLKINKNNIWAVKMPIDDEFGINILYSEFDDKKYMTCGNEKAKTWFGIIIGCSDESNPEMNKIFMINQLKDDISIREADTIEIANIFTTFECFRHFFNGWHKYEEKEDDLKIMKKFISSIKEEEIEEQ